MRLPVITWEARCTIQVVSTRQAHKSEDSRAGATIRQLPPSAVARQRLGLVCKNATCGGRPNTAHDESACESAIRRPLPHTRHVARRIRPHHHTSRPNTREQSRCTRQTMGCDPL